MSANENQTNKSQKDIQTYELTTNITKKDVATALVIVFVLLATTIGIGSCVGKERKIEKLKQAMRELAWQKRDKICDSLYQVTGIRRGFGEDTEDIDNRIQERIDDANQEIEYLRDEAAQQISKKYPLTKFLTSKELAQTNEDITARATNYLYPDSTYCRYYGNNIGAAVNDVLCELNGLYMIENPLTKTSNVYDFEIHMQTLYNLESRSGKTNFEDFTVDKTFYIQVPNENPVAMMQDGELSFTNSASQKLYEQYKNDIVDIDKKYIFNNPKFASRYAEYSAELIKAYEDREKLRQIGKFFDQQYKPKEDSLNNQLSQLNGKKL